MAASKFDYLNEYCKVVYLERTQGVSSTEIREGSTGSNGDIAAQREIAVFFLKAYSLK